MLERVTQVRAGLPAPRIVARQPAFTENFDRKAETHVGVYGLTDLPDQVFGSESSAGLTGSTVSGGLEAASIASSIWCSSGLMPSVDSAASRSSSSVCS